MILSTAGNGISMSRSQPDKIASVQCPCKTKKYLQDEGSARDASRAIAKIHQYSADSCSLMQFSAQGFDVLFNNLERKGVDGQSQSNRI